MDKDKSQSMIEARARALYEEALERELREVDALVETAHGMIRAAADKLDKELAEAKSVQNAYTQMAKVSRAYSNFQESLPDKIVAEVHRRSERIRNSLKQPDQLPVTPWNFGPRY